jgi:acyl carrier protein
MTPEKLQKLERVFRTVFELPRTAEVAAVSQTSQENWDSLRHVTLLSAVESEFNVSIDTAEALRINSFETTRQLLEERGI